MAAAAPPGLESWDAWTHDAERAVLQLVGIVFAVGLVAVVIRETVSANRRQQH